MCSVAGIRESDRLLMAASYDFYYGHGRLVVNKRGLRKQGLAQQAPYLEWESHYGSLTLNQFGRELPTAGMNERGLCIHLLEQSDGGHLATRDKHLNEIQWIQYQLDCFSSVEEVLTNLHEVSIEKSFFNLHYALCDSQHKVAFIDFIDGEARASVPEGTQPLVLTNDSYPHALSQLALSKSKTPKDNSSVSRFIRLARACLSGHYKAEADDMFRLLDLVYREPGFGSLFKWWFLRQPPAASFWGTVFDPDNRRVYWRTKDHKAQRYVDLGALEFANNTPVLTLDINRPLEGNVTSLMQPMQRSDNEELIRKSYAPLSNKVPPEDQKLLVDYPESFKPIEAGGIK